MVANDLIPELHDVLKLTGTHSHRSSQRPTGGPDTATWKGVLHHFDPTDAETLLLHLADRLAAASSRPESYGDAQVVHAVHKLWVGGIPRPVATLPEHEVMTFLAADPDWPGFVARYADALGSRAENAGGGINVTSLRTHMELTGKLYRLLEGRLDLSAAPQPENWGDANWVRSARESALQKTNLTVSHLKVEFLQRPVRAKDLNVLVALAEAVARIARDYADDVIFAAGEELLVASVGNATPTAIEAELAVAGFRVQAREVTGTIAEWTDQRGRPRTSAPTTLLRLATEPVRAVCGDLEESFPPPICEICQMAPGAHAWTGPEGDGPEEFLCGHCYGYRRREARLPKLAEWEEGGATRRLAWFRMELPVAELIKCLQGLYSDYLARQGLRPAQTDVEVRFSLLAEFQKDYQRLLEAVRSGLGERWGEADVQEVLPNLYCVRLEDVGRALEVLEVYERQVRVVMPAFVETKHCPLRARLMVADPKFPFGEIWRISEEAGAEVEVTLVGGRRLRTTHRRLRDLLSLRNLRLRPSALHNLAEIAQVSEELARLRWLDRSRAGDADTQTYRLIDQHLQWRHEDASGLDFEGLVAFAQMAGATKPGDGKA